MDNASPPLKIYFAGPLFSSAERAFNRQLGERLEALGFEVFLPQRDGVERDKLPYNTMSAEEKRQRLFETDRDEISKADIFLYVLDGRVPDEGAAVELGIAYAHKYLLGVPKLLIGLHTDVRASFLGAKLNPMLRVPLNHLVEGEGALIALLRDVLSARATPIAGNIWSATRSV